MTALLLAALPTLFYCWLLWRLDCYEKEPVGLLLAAFGWGALPALLLAGGAELGIGLLTRNVLGPDAPNQIIAPVIEEPLKALALIGLFRFAHQEFNDVIDGIIYGALVGFGFAMSENVLYFWSNPNQLLSLWLVRSVLFGFNHAFFTSIVGIALGLVRLERRRWVGYASLPLALGLAILFHALHNMSVTNGLWGLGLAWLIDTGGVAVVLVVAILARREEQRWLLHHLPDECNGYVLDPVDLQHVLNPALRLRAEIRALVHGGWLVYRHQRRFHHLVTELAFLKHQLAVGDRDCCQDDVEKLRRLVAAQRAMLPRR